MNPGIFYRLLLSLTLLFLLSTGFMAYSLINEAEDAYEAARLHQAHTMAQGLAEASLDALAVNDYELIEGWLRGTNAIDDFAYAYLSKANGLIISHTDIDLVAKRTKALGEITEPLVKNISYLKRPVREVVHSAYLGKKHLANAHLAYFTDTKSFYSETIIFRVVALLAITLAILSLVTFFILRWVLKPVEELADAMHKVTRNKDYSYRVSKQRKDEIGLLVNSFNNMLEQIQQRDSELLTEKELAEKSANEAKVFAHEISLTNNELENEISERIKIEHELKELSETLERRVKERTKKLEELNKIISDVSRSAGMAEIANGVLHNVGNVLNSVNVSSSLIREKLRNSATNNLAKLVEMLEDNKHRLGEFITTDEKGSQIPQFLKLLTERQIAHENDLITELDSLDKSINHIKNVVSKQQSYSGSFGVLESVNMAGLIEDALNISMSNKQDFSIKITKDLQSIPELQIDRHKVLQVIINLLSNARHALVDSEKPDKTLAISMYEENNVINIVVEDNGVGIVEDDMTQLFNYGFTKRKSGHGFGLHNSALIAEDLGGKITVKSEGPGKGANFRFYFKREN